MKRLLIALLIPFLMMIFIPSTVFATGAETKDEPFELIPKTKDTKRQEDVVKLQKKSNEDFWEQYNDIAKWYVKDKDKEWLWKMLASWIVTRDTILLLLTSVIRFVSNAALVFGSAMFIYAWYLYISSAIAWDSTWKANEAMKNAVIWVVIVIFSYAIQRIVVEGFLS